MLSTIIRQQVVKSSKVESGYVWVSTCNTFDHGLETMVFPCNERGDVLDWGEIASDRYEDVPEAESGHAATVSRFSL